MNRQPAFDDENLLCPHCGGDYVAHTDVVVFSRTGEDKGGVVRAILGTRLVSTIEQPSVFVGRRDSLTIGFVCESCGKTSVLCLVQHKGQTKFWFTESTEKSTP